MLSCFPMTHRAELLELQYKARRAGRVANFTLDTEGRIDGVFYLDPRAPALSRLRSGSLIGPLSFAEKERTAAAWFE